MPLDALLVGANNSREKKLSAKDVEFARQLALGESKAGAYRKSRETKAKPQTATRKGQALAKLDSIQTLKQAFETAFELERLRTPAQLRALVISELTKKAIDPNVKDAQQIKALELLGKVTEVAAFTERREVLKLSASVDIKERLLESLRAVAKSDAQDANTIDADSLLAELSALPAPEATENEPAETPPHPHPPETV